jgi:hypothetical protein
VSDNDPDLVFRELKSFGLSFSIQGVWCSSVSCSGGWRFLTRYLGFDCLPNVLCIAMELIKAWIFNNLLAAVNTAFMFPDLVRTQVWSWLEYIGSRSSESKGTSLAFASFVQSTLNALRLLSRLSNNLRIYILGGLSVALGSTSVV